jgi:hypothetical protein
MRRAARKTEKRALKSLNLGGRSPFVDIACPGWTVLPLSKIAWAVPRFGDSGDDAYGTVESAVEAMKAGLSIICSSLDLEHIDILISKIDEKQKLITENRYHKRKLNGGCRRIIGKSRGDQESRPMSIGLPDRTRPF